MRVTRRARHPHQRSLSHAVYVLYICVISTVRLELTFICVLVNKPLLIFVRPGGLRSSKDATSLRQSGRDIKRSLLELADPHSPSAKSVQYKVWDSRPQLSSLIEVKPELRPSRSWPSTVQRCSSTAQCKALALPGSAY